jgi:molybdenum cofactor cytidylyltransferase
LSNETLIHRVVRNLVEAGVGSIIVVTGHAADEILTALADLPVTFTHNSNYDAGGMLSSVQTGLKALPASAKASLIVLGDQPLIHSDTIRGLIDAMKSSEATIAIPSHDGKRGHPVLIARPLFDEVLALGHADTLKTLITRHEKEVLELPVNDPYTTTDVDTPQDYEVLVSSLQGKGPDHV